MPAVAVLPALPLRKYIWLWREWFAEVRLPECVFTELFHTACCMRHPSDLRCPPSQNY